MNTRAPVLLAALVLAVSRGSLAQCPDGSPPPCRAESVRAASASNSVAVLYFDNLTNDTAYAYLADGLTEELITRLGYLGRLEVKSRHASRRVRQQHQWTSAMLGRALSAAYLLSGSVQTSQGDYV